MEPEFWWDRAVGPYLPVIVLASERIVGFLYQRRDMLAGHPLGMVGELTDAQVDEVRIIVDVYETTQLGAEALLPSATAFLLGPKPAHQKVGNDWLRCRRLRAADAEAFV